MTRFLFIRHGETDSNRQQRFQGQIDVPLNANGRVQAARLAERLAATPADALYTSDLNRARQTAAALAAVWALPAQPLPAFREQAFGILEGMEVSAVPSLHPELWRQWLDHQADFALPGGESLVQLSERVLAAVRELAGRHAEGTVAVVTHGGVLDTLWRHAQALPLHGRRECEIPNTGINRLRWQEGRLVLEAWGDAAHLEGMDLVG